MTCNEGIKKIKFLVYVMLCCSQVDRLEDELASEQEKFKSISEELEATFAEMSGYSMQTSEIWRSQETGSRNVLIQIFMETFHLLQTDAQKYLKPHEIYNSTFLDAVSQICTYIVQLLVFTIKICGSLNDLLLLHRACQGQPTYIFHQQQHHNKLLYPVHDETWWAVSISG